LDHRPRPFFFKHKLGHGRFFDFEPLDKFIGTQRIKK